MDSKIYDLKIHVLHDAPVIFITCHKMPRLLHNLHVVSTWRSPDNAIRKICHTTRRKCCACCACHAKWRWRSTFCACNCKRNSSSENDAKELRLSHKNDFRHVIYVGKRHEKPRRPCKTKLRNDWNLQKWPLLQNWPEARPEANGCEQLRKVANGCDTSMEYTLSTQTPSVTRGPLLRIREQDTLPSHASQEMPGKILRSFFFRFWKWHPQSELVSRDPVCKRSNLLQHWFHQPCKSAKQFVHLYSLVVWKLQTNIGGSESSCHS